MVYLEYLVGLCFIYITSSSCEYGNVPSFLDLDSTSLIWSISTIKNCVMWSVNRFLNVTTDVAFSDFDAGKH